MKYSLWFMSIALLSTHNILNPFNSISQADHYIKLLKEYPDADYPQQWNNPRYTSLYTTTSDTVVGRALRRLHLLKKRLWNTQQFSDQLHNYVKKFTAENVKEYVLGTQIKRDNAMNLYVFGNLHGSVHSFMRSLLDLKKRGVIDDNFKLINPADYIIFLGNAINIGPYSIETLQLILDLQMKNQNHVIYLRGEHEAKLFWHNYSLHQEVVMRESHDKEQLLHDLQTYFESCPLALYLKDSASTPMLLALKCVSMIEKEELWEDFLQTFFASLSTEEIVKEVTFDNQKSSRLIYPRAIIEARNNWPTIEPTKPLAIKHLKKPVCTIYTLATCPSRAFRFLYRLFFDSYAYIQCNVTLETSKLTLYTNDVRGEKNLFTAHSYDLISGQQIQDGTKKRSL